MNKSWFLIQLAISFLPFILFAYLNGKANTKKEVRHRQYLMPVLAVVYSIVGIIFLSSIAEFLMGLVLKLVDLCEKFKLGFIGDFIFDIYTSWGVYLESILFNTAALFAFIVIKRILVTILGKLVVKPDSFLGKVMEIFYSYNEEDEIWYIKEHYGQARTFIKTAYYGSAVLSAIAMFVSYALCMNNAIAAPFYPVFAVIVIGEMAFFIDGLEKGEKEKGDFSLEADKSDHIAMYPLLRKPLKALFGDKLSAEGTTVNNVGIMGGGVEDILVQIEKEGDRLGRNYSAFIRKKMVDGLKPNVDYLRSGYELASGKSLLFNTPFYDKLNPYAFYAMNRALLTGGKVMIVLGRHGTEEDLRQWCTNGMLEVSNVPELWNIAVLDDKKLEDDELPDIGIVSRSSVHDLDIHKNNLAFLKKVSFVMLVEPSRLVTTAQIGLNLLIKNCGKDNAITFCSIDRNCDGLVDALSHILMTNITEVSATEYPHGTSSYMYWTADSDYMQHRILPGVSRYLGMGTELSAVALKNQVKKAVWYGGDSYPVRDARWIAKQYYYDILDYAQLPTTQETFDNSFHASFNICDERVNDYSYITVEDERNNLFETRRNFATIAEKQGFVNVISPEYMLREYMSANTELFTADAKAIPYITADYARTKRNIILTLSLLLCVDNVSEDVLRRQMMLLNIDSQDLAAELWKEMCVIFSDAAQPADAEAPVISVNVNGKTVQFEKKDTLLFKRVYSVDSGKFESVYTIENKDFIRFILDDLKSASYIAEQDSKDLYLGTELKGHIYQKYIPGQFFTLNGKYYEMVSTAADDRILVRRAADHIGGRLSYRQVRNYTINHLEDSQFMGELKTINNIDVHYQFADFTVDTPGYWKLGAYNDFDNGTLVTVNGVPTRKYHHKHILKLDFSKLGDGFTDSVRMTLTNLLNEVFVTLFAENQPFISAITPGQFEAPLTYNLNLAEGVENVDKCIFIVEDSQLDIGLLIAVERNIGRIFQIISDYLNWNDEQIAESIRKENEPEEVKEPEPFDVYDGKPAKKRGFFGKIADWFKGLFKKKDKKEKKGKKGKQEAEIEVPAQDYMMIYGKPHKFVNGKWVKCSKKEFEAKMAERHKAIEEKERAEKEAKEAEKQAAKEAAEQEATEQEPSDESDTTAETEPTDGEEQATEEEAPAEAEEPVAEAPAEAEEPVAEAPAEAEEPVAEAPAEAEEPVAEAPAKKMSWFERMRASKAEKKAAKEKKKQEKQAAKAAKKQTAEEEAEVTEAVEAEQPIEDAPVEEAEAIETPVEETSAEEITEEAPVEETSDEAPVEQNEEESQQEPEELEQTEGEVSENE